MGFKKFTKKASTAVKKRYGVGKGRGGFKFSKLAKDMEYVKSRLNVEKKFVDTARATASVGQVNENAQGYYANYIIPGAGIAQGDGESQRNGNSLKATGLIVKMNMIKQVNADGPRRLKVMIVKSVGNYALTTPQAIVDKLFDINPLTGVRDYHSNLDYTQLKDGRHKIIASRNVYLKSNSSDTSDSVWERETKALSIPVKINDVWRYESNADVHPENITYTIVILADNGNSSGTGSSIVGLFVPTNDSGIEFKHHYRWWYVDN